MHFDLAQIIRTSGYIGLFAVIFAESGLLIGFFLPGDSVLFTAGFLASQGFFDITLLCILMFIAAVTGDSVGYTFGHKVGRKLFQRPESKIFHPDHLKSAEEFYEKHGKKTIILARFLPVVRTFAPIVAGIGKMEYKTFLAYNLIGGFLWAVCITLAGYFLGSLIPDVDKYLLPIIVLIVIVSIIPQTIHMVRDPKMRATIFEVAKKPFRKNS